MGKAYTGRRVCRKLRPLFFTDRSIWSRGPPG